MGVGRGAWGVGREAWGVGRGAWGVGRGAWGVGRGAWGVIPSVRNKLMCYPDAFSEGRQAFSHGGAFGSGGFEGC